MRGPGSPPPPRTDARRTGGWRGGGRGSFVRPQVLYQRFELRGVHHGAEALGHDPRELLVALRHRRGRVEDLLADRLRVAPRADVREIGRDPPAKPPAPPPPPPPPVGEVVEVLEVAGMSDAVTSTVPP